MGDADALEHARCLDGVHLRCKHGEVFNAHSLFFEPVGISEAARWRVKRSHAVRDAVRDCRYRGVANSQSKIYRNLIGPRLSAT
mgnify:CR=1 FL=1